MIVLRENILNFVNLAIDFLKNNWFSIASTIGIVFSILLGLINYYSSKPKLSIIIPDGEFNKSIFEPDRDSATNPDKFWNFKYRIFIDVTISNQSRMPISIHEIRLNDDLKITPYNKVGQSYEITIESGHKMLPHGIQASGGPILRRGIDIDSNQLKPIINLNPYSSVRGILVFRYNGKIKDFQDSKKKLKLLTPLKTFEFSISEFQFFENHRLPRDQWNSENDETPSRKSS